MKYEVIFEKGRYALVKRGEKMEEYAVVSGLNKESGEWDHTCSYANFSPFFRTSEAEALSTMLDLFRSKTEEDYITRNRLIELATLFKDGLIEGDKETADMYFRENCEMTEDEMAWFGVNDVEVE